MLLGLFVTATQWNLPARNFGLILRRMLKFQIAITRKQTDIWLIVLKNQVKRI